MSRDSMWKMVILCVVSAMTSSEECVVEEKVGVTVDEVTSPAKVIREMEGSAESAQDCFQLCCRVANSDGCNLASFVHYYGISLCLLAMCEPLSLCTMKTYSGATSAILTSGNDTVFTSNDSDMLNVSVTDNTSPPADDKEMSTTKMPPISTSGADSSTVVTQPMKAETKTWWEDDNWWLQTTTLRADEVEGDKWWEELQQTENYETDDKRLKEDDSETSKDTDTEVDKLAGDQQVIPVSVQQAVTAQPEEEVKEQEGREGESTSDKSDTSQFSQPNSDTQGEGKAQAESSNMSAYDSVYATLASIIIAAMVVVVVVMLLRRLQRAKRFQDYEKPARYT